MSSFWENKYLNSERSIQFIQATHAEVLKGLHTEIESLQKQCADYAFKLSLQASTSAEKEEYDRKYKSYNAEYKKKDALISEQKKLIEDRNKSIKALEERVKTLEKKYDTDVIAKDQLIKQYKAQLDSQSLQIANLTYQIHHLSKTKANLNQTNDFNNKPSQIANMNESVEQQILNFNLVKKPNSPRMSKTNKTSKLSNSSSISENSSLAASNSNKNEIETPHSTTNSNQFFQSTKLSKSKLASNERKQSDDNNQQLIGEQQENEIYDSSTLVTDVPSLNRRSNSSNSNSARSDRSSTPPVKLLPPVLKRAAEIVPPPDPKPFLQSAASTLHTRTRKELIQRKTLISLPPIKPIEVNQFAVESPLKIMGHKSSSLVHGPGSHDQNNNATN